MSKVEFDLEPLDERPVAGWNLQGTTFGAQLGGRPLLLHFLRHLGCVFCRESVSELRKAAEADAGYPPVLFVFRGNPEDGAKFFSRFWPAARAIADPDGGLYETFALGRANLYKGFGPGVWWRAIRALLHGHSMGKIGVDPMRMPGSFIVHQGKVRWEYEAANTGDHPDFPKLTSIARDIERGK